MADNPNASIVDELIVTLGLDATQYEKADKTIIAMVGKTEKQFEDADRKDKRRSDEKKKRLESGTKQIKAYGENLTKLAGIAGAVLGVGGGVAGFIGMLAALSSTESAMRRATVATGMSVRSLNAWRGTMAAVTGDAEGGANAVTGLARELTVGRLTGQMPTLQAFASVGVGYRNNEALESFLGRAQHAYRAAPAGQQQNIEAQLAARGVDANLIQLLKSNQNVGDVFGKKYASSAEMNEGGVDAFNSALADFKNSLRNTATTIMTVVTPAIQAFGEWMNTVNPVAAQFADDMKAAGGGVDGFIKVVDQRAPELGAALHDVGAALTTFGQVVDVAVFGLSVMAKAFAAAYDWINDHLGKFLNLTNSQGQGNALDRVKNYLGQWWNDTVRVARTYGPAPVASLTGAPVNPNGARLTADAQRRLGAMANGSAPRLPGRATDRSMQFMNEAIAAGFSPAQAAAIASNAFRESGFNPGAFNAAGGGNGAAGLFQWRGARATAFRQRYGVAPNQGTTQQALDFIMNDPYERRLLQRSLAGAGSAADAGERFSRIFEAHGNRAEDANRGRLAQSYYDDYLKQTNGGRSLPDGVAGAPQINLNGPVTVVADNPREFGNGIQRAAGVQAYSSGVR